MFVANEKYFSKDELKRKKMANALFRKEQKSIPRFPEIKET